MAHSLPSIPGMRDSLICGLGPNVEPVRCHLPPWTLLSPGRLSPDNPGGKPGSREARKPICVEQVDSGKALGEGELSPPPSRSQHRSTRMLGSSDGNWGDVFTQAEALPNLSKHPHTLPAEIIPPHVPDSSCPPLCSPPPQLPPPHRYLGIAWFGRGSSVMLKREAFKKGR